MKCVLAATVTVTLRIIADAERGCNVMTLPFSRTTKLLSRAAGSPISRNGSSLRREASSVVLVTCLSAGT